jgi:hypothetical protein
MEVEPRRVVKRRSTSSATAAAAATHAPPLPSPPPRFPLAPDVALACAKLRTINVATSDVLREQSGRLPVTSNDSQFTMFTKCERAIAAQLRPGLGPVISRPR